MAVFSSPFKPSLLLLYFGFITLLLSACQSAQVKPKGLTDAQIAALKEVGFQPSDEGWEFSQSDKILFDSDEDDLNSGSRQTIERIGRMLVKVAIERVRVDGHTDSEGEADYNQQLSIRRASAVAEALMSVGVPAYSIRVRGLGMTAPVANNRTSDGRAQNRRVAIVITAG